jgi:hypothetical protein
MSASFVCTLLWQELGARRRRTHAEGLEATA